MLDDELPPELDPRYWLETGASVIEHGLPDLPAVLYYGMSIPICFWAAGCCAVVTYMQFRADPEDGWLAMTSTVPYVRQGDGWKPRAAGSFSWSSGGFDPIADPGHDRDLDGNSLTYGRTAQCDTHQPGQPASAAVDRISPAVQFPAVIQNGRQDYPPGSVPLRRLVVCTEQPHCSSG